jgi:hypothetical protein
MRLLLLNVVTILRSPHCRETMTRQSRSVRGTRPSMMLQRMRYIIIVSHEHVYKISSTSWIDDPFQPVIHCHCPIPVLYTCTKPELRVVLKRKHTYMYMAFFRLGHTALPLPCSIARRLTSCRGSSRQQRGIRKSSKKRYVIRICSIYFV